MRTPLSHARSIFFLHLSNILFAASAICISLLSGSVDGYFTSFCRFLVGLFIGFSQLALSGRKFKIVRFKPWLGRGFFGSVAMTLYYISINLGNPGRATLFNTSFPIFVAIIAIVFFRDPVGWRTILGIIFSFSGVALVLWEGTELSLIADLAGLLSGILAGLSYHFNKIASKTEDPVVIYLGVCFVGLVLNSFSAPQLLRVDLLSALLLVLAGFGAYFAQIAITIGLRDIPTTEGSVHTFAKIPLTVMAGWLLLGDSLSLRFIGGTCLLIAGLIINQSSKRKEPA